MGQVLNLCTEKQTKFVVKQVYKKLVYAPFAFFKNYLFISVTFDVDGLQDANFGYTKVYSDFDEAKADNFSKLGELNLVFDINHDQVRQMDRMYPWASIKRDAAIVSVFVTALVILNTVKRVYIWITGLFSDEIY